MCFRGIAKVARFLVRYGCGGQVLAGESWTCLVAELVPGFKGSDSYTATCDRSLPYHR
jgi:hypothetical protein